jgi:hypothetical protein
VKKKSEEVTRDSDGEERNIVLAGRIAKYDSRKASASAS